MDLKDARKKKSNILANAFKGFIDSIKSTESRLFSKILKILNGFDESNGTIDRSTENRKKARKIQTDIANAIATSTVESKTRKFIRNFDQLESVNLQIMEATSGLTKKQLDTLDFSETKSLYVEKVIKGMLTKKGREVSIDEPLRLILWRHATLGIKKQNAVDEIRRFLIGKGAAGGKLARYAHFLAFESIRKFDGHMSQIACAEFNLNVFRIYNPLIKTSHQNCIEMIEMTGELGQLAVGQNLYLVEEIPEIIEIGKSRNNGINEETNEQTYFIDGNHTGCRHGYECSKRSAKWIEEAKILRAKRNKS